MTWFQMLQVSFWTVLIFFVTVSLAVLIAMWWADREDNKRKRRERDYDLDCLLIYLSSISRLRQRSIRYAWSLIDKENRDKIRKEREKQAEALYEKRARCESCPKK